MISFHYELDFKLEQEDRYRSWIERIVESEGFGPGEIQYIFCTDDYLLDLHIRYLHKDSLTDIITFDYSEVKTISGDIFISVERVRENALLYSIDVQEELLRVMAHGVLHMIGYGDKDASAKETMRQKENEKIKMFHVEQ